MSARRRRGRLAARSRAIRRLLRLIRREGRGGGAQYGTDTSRRGTTIGRVRRGGWRLTCSLVRGGSRRRICRRPSRRCGPRPGGGQQRRHRWRWIRGSGGRCCPRRRRVNKALHGRRGGRRGRARRGAGRRWTQGARGGRCRVPGRFVRTFRDLRTAHHTAVAGRAGLRRSRRGRSGPRRGIDVRRGHARRDGRRWRRVATRAEAVCPRGGCGRRHAAQHAEAHCPGLTVAMRQASPGRCGDAAAQVAGRRVAAHSSTGVQQRGEVMATRDDAAR